MRFTLALLLATSLAVAHAEAADFNGQHESAAQRMADLATLLDLTETQRPQVEAILTEEHAKARAAHEQAEASGQQPTHEEMHAAHELLKKETIAKLTPILTPTQLKKFEIIMTHEPMRGPPPGAPPPQ